MTGLQQWLSAIPFERGPLMRFHAAHKLLYMAHSPSGQHALGRLVAAGDATAYPAAALAVLSIPATTGKHVNALEHAAGMLKRLLTDEERGALRQSIERYRQSVHPLAVPLALLRADARRVAPGGWLALQVYLDGGLM
jgi:uncharacterized protein YbgA (DUF1722 family)